MLVRLRTGGIIIGSTLDSKQIIKQREQEIHNKIKELMLLLRQTKLTVLSLNYSQLLKHFLFLIEATTQAQVCVLLSPCNQY